MSVPDHPAFVAAVRYRRPLTALCAVFSLAGVALVAALGASLAGWPSLRALPWFAGYLGAALLLPAAGFGSAASIARARIRASVAGAPGGAAGAAPPRGWIGAFAAFAFGGTALAAVVATWWTGERSASDVPLQQWIGAALVLSSIPLLVVDRVHASTASEALPEAPQLAQLVRVPLVAFFGTGIASVLDSLGLTIAPLERALAVLVGLVAAELVVRAAAHLFLPFADLHQRRSVASSWLAAQLRWRMPRLSRMGQTIADEFGVDLSRSWALGFVRSAGLPIAVAVAVFGWCVTGITAVGISERAVYERFGVPVAVFQPGLHLHLPWPLGVMRPVELGVVHEIPLVSSERSGPTALSNIDVDTKAEGIPSRSADRLWDASHPAEASYLIASETAGKQSFQIANIDMRIVYRIGLSDEDARHAAYAVADPETFIHAGAGQLLVRYFARFALADVLGQSRETFSREFRDELQQTLDRQSSGLELIAVIVETIHPPSGAASAYHDVQAAEVAARTAVALRRAEAIQMQAAARRTATGNLNEAVARQAELVAAARTDGILFSGDLAASTGEPRAFLFERWLDRLGTGLAKSSLVVIDGRLTGASAPTIDLRQFAPPKEIDALDRPAVTRTQSKDVDAALP